MNNQIINGIQLPAFDVEMLALGKLIVVPFKQFQAEGKAFWLYPCQQLPNNLSLEEYYQPEYLAKARNSLAKYSTYPIHLKFWARCEYQWRINPDQKDLLPKVAQSTIWNLSALENIFEQQKVLKFLMLRVYYLSKPCIVNIPTDTGLFYWTKSEDIVHHASENDIPVVSDSSFSQRKNLILSGNISPYQNIEALQFQCENISETNRDIEKLNHDIKQFLGWYSVPPIPKLDKSLDWIKNIANVGNSSDGNEFERLVRKSFVEVGFSSSNTNSKANLDPDKLGGAGGLDFYCEYPYRVVGECKATATEKVSDGTASQLSKLGYKHLQQEYNNCIKIIMAAGKLTKDAEETAKGNQMNVIRPETLQRLVELKAKHPGSIDLLNLKPYLEKEPFGEASNDKINEYIDKIEKEIKLRSHIIQVLKNYLQLSKNERIGVEALHAVYVTSKPPQNLGDKELYDILIELSSPLTGYLGRIKEDYWKKDRFYYLRDLPIN
ncbi:DUF1802 family protein [Aphanizomenon flos-aquae]|uniref:DUF1802 family protein n=1 Tax=Aphanizomenon flos-aquae FACHB-1040 TaxID=2692887 RepID=A0ABR8BZ70_APHFL|nr:DUF1802 family protein [Aphanizomenon flos-aquae]MBD2279765.1 DUF1802 family protein [Aphanizomenon flos-aquae FACHB-1040]